MIIQAATIACRLANCVAGYFQKYIPMLHKLKETIVQAEKDGKKRAKKVAWLQTFLYPSANQPPYVVASR